MIVDAAVQEDVDAIGVSILSGAHMTLFPAILEEMKAKIFQPLKTYEEAQKLSTQSDVNPGYILPKMFMFRLQKIMDEYAAGVTANFMTNKPCLDRALELAPAERTVVVVGHGADRVREAVRRFDADRPLDQVSSLEALKEENIAPERLNATLFTSFAVLALLIAAVGVLGVLAFTVSQRTQEFGVRMALGAQRAGVLRMVLRQGLGLALAGVPRRDVGYAGMKDRHGVTRQWFSVAMPMRQDSGSSSERMRLIERPAAAQLQVMEATYPMVA